MEMNKKWKKFDSLTSKCYDNMVGTDPDGSCWKAAFDLLKEIIAEGRSEDAGYAPELYLLDDATDFGHDIQGWLEDYLDELDMREMKEELIESCEDLLQLFKWEEDSPSYYNFRRISALGALGRNEEALRLSKEWLEKEEDNMLAVTSGVYANMGCRNFDEAEYLIKKYIDQDTECTEENDILFIAAGEFYKIAGNKKEQKRIEKILKEYDKMIEQELMDWGEDDELPFMDDDFLF